MRLAFFSGLVRFPTARSKRLCSLRSQRYGIYIWLSSSGMPCLPRFLLLCTSGFLALYPCLPSCLSGTLLRSPAAWALGPAYTRSPWHAPLRLRLQQHPVQHCLEPAIRLSSASFVLLLLAPAALLLAWPFGAGIPALVFALRRFSSAPARGPNTPSVGSGVPQCYLHLTSLRVPLSCPWVFWHLRDSWAFALLGSRCLRRSRIFYVASRCSSQFLPSHHRPSGPAADFPFGVPFVGLSPHPFLHIVSLPVRRCLLRSLLLHCILHCAPLWVHGPPFSLIYPSPLSSKSHPGSSQDLCDS